MFAETGWLRRRLGRWSASSLRSALALALIVALALALRLVQLGEVPPNVTADEADNLQVVYHILADEGPGFFGLDWKPNPAFSVYIISVSLRVFGENVVAMRLPSVLLTTLALIAFYFVARQVLSRPASLGATFLLGTGLWYLHFSRSGWENAHVGLYALMVMLTLQLALRCRSWHLYAASGFFAALGLYGYMSGRAIIVALVLYLPIAMFLHRGQQRQVALGFSLAVLVAFVVFAPQLRTVVSDWNKFNYRVADVSIFNTGGEYRGDAGLPVIMARQVWRAIDGFFLLDADISQFGLNGRYLPAGWPILDRATGVLFWLGAVGSLYWWRRTALWWVMLLTFIFPVQVLSTGTPDAARAVGAAPLFYLFVGMGLDLLLKLPAGRWMVSRAAVLAMLAVIAYINVSGYFHWMELPLTAVYRQPAVELEEFEIWQRLQMEEAEAGRWGFHVGQWHEMRDQYLR